MASREAKEQKNAIIEQEVQKRQFKAIEKLRQDIENGINPFFKVLFYGGNKLFGLPESFVLSSAGILLFCAVISWFSKIYELVGLAVVFVALVGLGFKKDHRFYKRVRNAMRFKMPFFFRGIKNKSFMSVFSTKPVKEMSNDIHLNENRENALEYFKNQYECFLDNGVILTSNYTILGTIQLRGIDFLTTPKKDLNETHASIYNVFKNFATPDFRFYFHTVKKRVVADDVNRDYGISFSNDFMQSYNERQKKENFYEISFFLTIEQNLLGLLDEPVMNRSHFEDKNFEDFQRNIAVKLEHFKEKIELIEELLKKYHPTRLKEYTKDGVIFSKQCEFYNFLVGMNEAPFICNRKDLYLKEKMHGGVKEVYFANKHGKILNDDLSEKYFSAIEISEYSPKSQAELFDKINALDSEFIFMHAYVPKNSQILKEKLANTSRRIIISGGSKEQGITLGCLSELVGDGDITLGSYGNALVLFADNLEKMNQSVKECIAGLNSKGFLASAATFSMENYFFAKNCSFLTLPFTFDVTSNNFADFIAMRAMSFSGNQENNAWGNSVMTLKSEISSPFYLNFHMPADFGSASAGHTLILGSTGSGKTMFMSMTLNAMGQFVYHFPANVSKDKQKLTMVYMDKDYGAYGNIVAMGGEYVKLELGEDSRLNPFQFVQKNPSPTAIQTLKSLVKMLITRKGGITIEQEERLNAVIDSMLSSKAPLALPITQLIKNLGEEVQDSQALINKLIPFSRKHKGEFGWLFDNEEDCLDFDKRIVGIDGSSFLDNNDVSPYICFYLFARIQEAMDGRRFVLDIDEAWKYLSDEKVALFVKDMLKTARKKNAFVRLATQSIVDLLACPIADTIREQCPTKIFLRNDGGVFQDYQKIANVTEREFEIITKGLDRKILFKQDGSPSVIANVNLRGIPYETLKILSTDTAYVTSIDKIVQDPNITDKYQALRQMYLKERE
ncbi:type IV secretion/conjugal transfer ATPase, VirB4 family [Helicobacter pylori GAM96Ai]|uniref:VirB4 family type IV secretion/conjugal transfer ATPase n=1 Tax=Helicobacter pylori TaxID=210 RepID=UPI0002BA10AA|nr:VirB4 family type IV secretion/conjugal transfer ATPase [Helicobacter pylori]EMH44827.1 type IV secretion/conjugal transfer ATPase, VirB4 family [Helicobacter pylori GAM96Ai]